MTDGCAHYQNRCEIFAPCCKTYYRCFRCHNDDAETRRTSCNTTRLDRSSITKIRCVECGLEQKPAKECDGCQISFADYVCLECSLYRQNEEPNGGIFHCRDCGFCRLGLGLGISHWHCHSCCLCLSLELVDPEQHSKICNMDTTHADCPICFEPLHDSRDPVVMGYYCGHYLHKSCCDAYFQKSWKVACPICQKPLIQMKDEKKSVKRTLSFKLLIMLVVFPLAGIGIVKMQTTTQFSSLSSQVLLALCVVTNIGTFAIVPRRRWFIWRSALLLVALHYFMDAFLQNYLRIPEDVDGSDVG